MVNKVVIVFGMRGTGKSNHIRNVILKDTHKKIVVIDSLDEYGKFLIYPKDYEDLKTLLKRPEFKIGILETQYPVDKIFELIYKIGDITLIVEEIDLYCNTAYIPEGLAKILRYGRHKNIIFYATVRRPQELHKLITSQATELVIFNIQELRDLDYFRKRLPYDFNIEKITRLKNLHYVSYDILKRKIDFKRDKLILDSID